MTAITNAANLNGTGRPDLLARDATGNLWLYPLTGNAVFGPRSRVGSGWNGRELQRTPRHRPCTLTFPPETRQLVVGIQTLIVQGPRSAQSL